MAAASQSDTNGRPLVVEILGVAGAGKSTLAENLAAKLTALGYPSADSRSTRRAGYGALARLLAALRAAPECVRLAVFVTGRVVRGVLPPSALRRLAPGFQHARQLQLLVRRLGPGGVAIQEPGWLMELLTQYIHAKQPLDPETASRYVAAGPRCDLAILLRASPEVILARMRSRKRGLPQSFRAFDDVGLVTALRQGDAAGAALAAACRARGARTVEFNVDALSADTVAEQALAVVLRLIDGRGDGRSNGLARPLPP